MLYREQAKPFLMDEGNTHIVLVDVLENDPTKVTLTIATAVERKPLAHIKLAPHIALHVSRLLKEGASIAWAHVEAEKLKIELPQPATSKD